jgi:hypothetical protein
MRIENVSNLRVYMLKTIEDEFRLDDCEYVIERLGDIVYMRVHEID